MIHITLCRVKELTASVFTIRSSKYYPPTLDTSSDLTKNKHKNNPLFESSKQRLIFIKDTVNYWKEHKFYI